LSVVVSYALYAISQVSTTKDSGTADKSSAESQETRSQARCKGHWVFCV